MGFFETIFGSGDEQERGDKLDAQLEEMNSRDYAPGGKIYENISSASGQDAADNAYTVTQNDLATRKTGNVEAQISGAFGEGLQDGINNEKSFVNGAVFGFLKAIPVSVWMILAVAGFVYFGGLGLIKRKVATA